MLNRVNDKALIWWLQSRQYLTKEGGIIHQGVWDTHPVDCHCSEDCGSIYVTCYMWGEVFGDWQWLTRLA